MRKWELSLHGKEEKEQEKRQRTNTTKTPFFPHCKEKKNKKFGSFSNQIAWRLCIFCYLHFDINCIYMHFVWLATTCDIIIEIWLAAEKCNGRMFVVVVDFEEKEQRLFNIFLIIIINKIVFHSWLHILRFQFFVWKISKGAVS